jgi:hypothetical protein
MAIVVVVAGLVMVWLPCQSLYKLRIHERIVQFPRYAWEPNSVSAFLFHAHDTWVAFMR